MTPRTVRITRYVTPLREGGSLPALVEADDDGMYVVKFRGAGQGSKALVAEWIGGELARVLGLKVPEIVFAELDATLARTEPDPEIQHLLRESAGLNLALDYLPGAINFDPLAFKVSGDVASRVVWLDAYIGNVDRSARNTNLLWWHRALWLIDHGAAFVFHHDWPSAAGRVHDAFSLTRQHVLLPWADRISEVDAEMVQRLTAERLAAIVAAIPAAWLANDPFFDDETAHRAAYLSHLVRRLEAPRAFMHQAVEAQRAYL